MHLLDPRSSLALLASLGLLLGCPSDDGDSPFDGDDDAGDDDVGDDDAGDDDAGDDDAGDDDAGDDDAGDDDAGDDDDDNPTANPDWTHCPDATDAVGSPTWTGVLEATNEARFCAAPPMLASLDAARRAKFLAQIVPGSYAFPTGATADAPWLLPACLWSPTISLATAEGTLDALADDNLSGSGWALQGSLPLGDNSSLAVGITMPAGAQTVTLGGATTFDSGLTLQQCGSEDCASEDDALLVPCDLEVNVCDLLEFDRGWVALDQHHWSGNADAGFAALQRAHGEFDGLPFDISNYWDLALAYGLQAFTRTAEVSFGGPIGDVCGLRLGEVSDGGAATATFEGILCAGGTTPLELTGELHTWHEGACAN
jgi:hypothetical protein